MYELSHLNEKIKSQGLLKLPSLLELALISSADWRSAVTKNSLEPSDLNSLAEAISKIISALEILEDTDETFIFDEFENIQPYFKKSKVLKDAINNGEESLKIWADETAIPNLSSLFQEIDKVKDSLEPIIEEVMITTKPKPVIDRVQGKDRVLKRNNFMAKSFEELQVEQEVNES